jgi:HK97 family phage major capsid protein
LGVATWTAEEAAYTESDDAFGQVSFSNYKLGWIGKITEELLNDSVFPIGSHIVSQIGRAIGKGEDAAFVAGDGSGKPTGVVNGSSLGVTAAGAAAITSDEVIDLYHSLGRPYRGQATWMAADATVKLLRKLKDGDNQYLWQPGLQAGQPDSILGRPLVTSDNVPAATTGLRSVVFGDMSAYYIIDRTPVAVQRLDELYAANGFIGFRGFERTDGKLTQSAAVKHLIQA